MAQFATFQVGLGGGEAAAAELNAFLRSHRVLKVERVAFPEGWTFCVEWLEGEEGASGRNSTEWRRSRKVDYMKVLPPEAFARYMDDFVLWADDAATLRCTRDEITAFSSSVLSLELKPNPQINRTRHGMDFLGMRVFPRCVRLNRASRNRFCRKQMYFAGLLAEGKMSDADYQIRAGAVAAFAEEADSQNLRRRFFSAIME